jgi:XTP/dITP diphosphohydrolase
VSSANETPRLVLLATRSAGKLRELRELIGGAGLRVTDLRELELVERPEEATLENADTFEANALAKARHFHRVSGMPTIADDSGLEVLALRGAPGVHSKRWSGRTDLTGEALDGANNALLLLTLADAKDRRARYVCAAAYCDSNGEFVERGEVSGAITRKARGSHGFGYDPYFESAELGRTFGEASPEEKSRVSHRARAFAKLLRRLTPRG